MNTATITPRENALGRICGYDVTTPAGEVVPFQSYAHAKNFVTDGCPLTVTVQDFPVGTEVTFKPEFSIKLNGMRFIVDAHYPAGGAEPKDMVGIKIKGERGRWAHRLAYVSDLIDAGR